MSSSPSKQPSESSPPPTPEVSGCELSQSEVEKLRRLATEFGNELQTLLNSTVCNNAHINAQREGPTSPVFAVGNRLTRQEVEGEHIPLCRRGLPTGWLKVVYRLRYDPSARYLMVLTAFVAVYAADAERTPLCHFDYERDKEHGYPEAHVQVYGTSPALAAWGEHHTDRGLQRLHFPAGHRRFRWILEDVIEFLVSEKLADPHDEKTWKNALKSGRKKFMKSQLRAAIRNDTDTAVDYLNEHDYEVRPKGALKSRFDKLTRRGKKNR